MTNIKHITMPVHAKDMTKEEIFIYAYDEGYTHAKFELEKKWAEKNEIPMFRFLDNNKEAAKGDLEQTGRYRNTKTDVGSPIHNDNKGNQLTSAICVSHAKPLRKSLNQCAYLSKGDGRLQKVRVR